MPILHGSHVESVLLTSCSPVFECFAIHFACNTKIPRKKIWTRIFRLIRFDLANCAGRRMFGSVCIIAGILLLFQILVCNGIHRIDPLGLFGSKQATLSCRGGEDSSLDADACQLISSGLEIGSQSAPPQGFYMEHDAVSDDIWKSLQRWLQSNNNNNNNSIPWEIGAPNRKVAQFGFRYNYESSQVEFSDDAVPPIPSILRTLLLDECATKVLSKLHGQDPRFLDPTLVFTQCIINIYNADDIIPWHWDHVDFGPMILVFTFDESRPLQMRRLLRPLTSPLARSQCHHMGENTEDYEYYNATPRHGSCYVLSGPSRYQWEHSVPPGKGFRMSITFRTHQVNNK